MFKVEESVPDRVKILLTVRVFPEVKESPVTVPALPPIDKLDAVPVNSAADPVVVSNVPEASGNVIVLNPPLDTPVILKLLTFGLVEPPAT